jgi:hypothetical protein
VALRAIVRRRPLEALPLAVLVMAVVQYLVFANGADVHIFWPHLFAPWFALGMGALVATVGGVQPKRQLAALGVGLLVCGAILPDGLRALDEGRATGLRFDEKGRFIEQSLDQTAAMRWLAARLPVGAGVGVHASVHHSWSLDWALARPTREEPALPTGPDAGFPFFVADRRFLSGAELTQLGREHALSAVGPLVIVERAAPVAPAEAFAVVRREPRPGERLFGSAHEPVMTIEPDPLATWELRQHLGQPGGPLPPLPSEPVPLEARLRAHNLALASGDDARAAVLREELIAGLDRRAAARLPNGVELLGTQREPGVRPRLHVVFRAPGPIAPDARFVVRARVVAPPRGSWVTPSERPRLVGPPFLVPSSLWRAGFLYESVIELLPGGGRTRYSGGFEAGEATPEGEGSIALGDFSADDARR